MGTQKWQRNEVGIKRIGKKTNTWENTTKKGYL
jgi:hypothetical protein